MKYTKYLAIGVFASSLLVFCNSAVAADEHWTTIAPPAYYATIIKGSNAQGAKVYSDSSWADLKWTGPPDPTEEYEQILYTRDFTAPTPPDYEYYTVFWPESNATITSVYLIALIHAPSSPEPFDLSYSVGHSKTYFVADETTYTLYTTSSSPYVYLWNVSNYETWTYSMMLSDTLWARLRHYGESPSFYVEYLGFWYNWTRPGSGPGWNPTYTGPDENETAPGDWMVDGYLNLSGGVVKGAVGAIGFFGMIATPAAGVALARQSDDRVAIFGKAFFAMLIFFALFLVGIS